MVNSQVKDTLIIFRVGPVYCCAPVDHVQGIIVPPQLTQPPGSTRSEPGIFHHQGSVIRVVDLRERFGVEEGDREAIGRLIITQLPTARIGYWVDAIGDVLPRPEQGWSELPPQVPREIFTQAFIHQDHITLLTDFERVRKLRSHHLAGHLKRIKQDRMTTEEERPSAPAPEKAVSYRPTLQDADENSTKPEDHSSSLSSRSTMPSKGEPVADTLSAEPASRSSALPTEPPGSPTTRHELPASAVGGGERSAEKRTDSACTGTTYHAPHSPPTEWR